MRPFFHRRSRGSFTQNIGRPGVIYILENGAFKAHVYKIGCSTRSGESRAADLNRDARTGTPAWFTCLHERWTQDCGSAEIRIFEELARHRRGKWGQEYFEVDLEIARTTIERVCRAIDEEEARKATPFPSSSSRTSPRPVFEPLLAATPDPSQDRDPQFRSQSTSRSDARFRLPRRTHRLLAALFATGLAAAIGVFGFLGRSPDLPSNPPPTQAFAASDPVPAPPVAPPVAPNVLRRDKAVLTKPPLPPTPGAPARGKERTARESNLTEAQRDGQSKLATVGLRGAPRLVFATMRLRLEELTDDERRELDVACPSADEASDCFEQKLALLYASRSTPKKDLEGQVASAPELAAPEDTGK